MRANSITLNIAGIIINIRSAFPLQALTSKLTKNYRNRKFIYRGRKPPEIIINLHIAPQIPSLPQAKKIFQAFHFAANTKDWSILRLKDKLVYKRLGEERPQVMIMNKALSRIEAYFLPKDADRIIDNKHRERAIKCKGYIWSLSDIVYDFLQILIMEYLGSVKKDGLLIHGVGIKDINNQGLLFLGKSGAGKTTLAKIYHNHSAALVLNDECVIIRKHRRRFFIYSSPWHGEFEDYFARGVGRAVLKRIFLLNKSKKNSVIAIQKNTGIASMHSNIFLPFWDKKGLENTLSIVNEISAKTPYFKLYFKKAPSVINIIEDDL